jgi:hypothetical protein
MLSAANSQPLVFFRKWTEEAAKRGLRLSRKGEVPQYRHPVQPVTPGREFGH